MLRMPGSKRIWQPLRLLHGCCCEPIFFRTSGVVFGCPADSGGVLDQCVTYSDAIIDCLLLAVAGGSLWLGLVSLAGGSGWFSANSGFVGMFWFWIIVVIGGSVA
jgi:hypothetical protein